MQDTALVTVASFLHRGDAEVARARLVGAGLDAMVQADDEGGLNPGFFAEYRVRLVVRPDDAARASTLLEEEA